MLRTLCAMTVCVGLAVSTAGCGGETSSHSPSHSMTLSESESSGLDQAYDKNFEVAQDVQKSELPATSQDQQQNTEEFSRIVENEFELVSAKPLSTFSVDVDTASYSIMRRFLKSGQRPPKHAIRVEEMVNYFDYDYSPPTDNRPFAVHADLATCPWNADHYVARIGLKGKVEAKRPLSNLVFLLDVSGSMEAGNKLPLVKAAMDMMLNRLGENDRVSIVVYAGASGLALPATPAHKQQKIRNAIHRLAAGGSTNGGEGIQLAYRTAIENFIPGGINRVILCTDGDFNVGVDSPDQLEDLIKEKAESNVFLSVLGFGSGNYKDNRMETLADKGNGNYAYIDSQQEAQKVLVEQISGTLMTIAKDVKVQVDFNPAIVAGYRLIGYENRMLNARDFKDDTKDAGEIGAGHTVTALYELIPVGAELPESADSSKYVMPATPTQEAAMTDELLTVRLRYKEPEGDVSTEFRVPVEFDLMRFEQSPVDFQFANAVAAFGMLLRESRHAGSSTYSQIETMAINGRGNDHSGRRTEFVDLVRRARKLVGRHTAMTN